MTRAYGKPRIRLYTIKQGITARPGSDGQAIRIPVYHVYAGDGAYLAQAMDMEKDLDRAIRGIRTREAKG